MDVVIELIKDFGLPVAALFALAIYHVRVVQKKDATLAAIQIAKDKEIARLNEERLVAKECETTRLLELVQEFNALQNEQTATLKVLAERRSHPYR